MLGALRLILSLTGRHTELLGAHAKARATHLALLAGFGVAAFAFLVTLVTVALARGIGTLPALGVMAGLCFAACLGVLLAMRSERRAHRLAQRLQAEEDRRALQGALIAALPAARRGGLLAAGAGALALALIGRRRRPDRDRRR